MACSPDPAGQDLIDLSSSEIGDDVPGYLSCDAKDVMAMIVRNESRLWKRAKISRVVPTASIILPYPTHTELDYQYCVNEEFLARRLKRRYFQQHLEYRGEYQEYLEAAQAHLDARVTLNSSIFSVQNSSQAFTSIRTWQEAAPQATRIPTVSSSTQTDEVKDAAVRPSHPSPPSSSESDNSSVVITAPLPGPRRCTFSTVSSESGDSSMTIRPSRPRAPSPPSAAVLPELDNSTGMATGSWPQDLDSYRWVHQAHERLQSVMDLDIDDEARGFIESREEAVEDSRLIELDDGEAREQENKEQDQFAEWSGFVGGLSDEWAERGRSRPHPPHVKVPLDSPEGLARLVDVRSFLGMRPDTKPLDIWNFAVRNKDLMANITSSTLPVRHRHLGQAKRPGYDRDPGLDTIQDFADDKWELRKGFVDVWNSLNWTFEALSGLGSDVPRSVTDEISGDDNIDELNLALNVEDFIADGINIDDLNIEDGIARGQIHEQENEEEEKSIPLDGRHARMPIEVNFRGKLRAPKHQPRNASRLRMSWTYADRDNIASSTISEDETVSPLSSPPISPTSQDEPVSPPSPLQTPQDEPSLGSPADAGSPASLEDGNPSVEPEYTAPSTPSQEDPQSAGACNDSSSYGSISPHIFERKPPSSLVQADSTRGKTMLSQLRTFLAMPESKTPQAISLFIDLHPELMKAIRTGHVPLRKVPMPLSKKQEVKAHINPLRTLRATNDPKQRFMRQNLIYALKMLDWEEIDSAPVPFTPPSPWDDGFVAEGDRVDGDDEEECDTWVRTTVTSKPNRLALIDGKSLAEYRCKEPSPLRTTLTRREGEGTTLAQGETEEEIPSAQHKQVEGAAPTRRDPEEGSTATTLSEPEIWENVDLNVSFPVPESDR